MVVILARALGGRTLRRVDTTSARWAYLGWSVEGKENGERWFGSDRFVSLAERVQETAQALMMPYIDAVGRLSSQQADPLNWLASKFASRSIWQTKFFQRLVMTRLALEILGPSVSDGVAILVIEDAWVFEALRAVVAGTDGPEFIGAGRLWRSRARHRLVSPLKRMGLAGYTLLFRWLASCVYRYRGQDVTRPPVGEVILHAYLEDRTIGPDGRYRDEYLGILGDIAGAAGLKVVRVTQLFYAWRLTGRAAQNATIWPLILSLPYAAIVRSLFSRWRPAGLEALEVPGVPAQALRKLLAPERMAEWGAGYMAMHLTFAAQGAYLRARPAGTLVYPFENQPWEKLLCWAASAQNPRPRLVGFQQSTVARMFVHFFRSRWEDERFFPDRILVSGEQFAALLMAGGWASWRISTCGALRHAAVLEAPPMAPSSVGPDGRASVIVALPVDEELSREILTALRPAFPDGGKRDALRLIVRFHPAGRREWRRAFADWLAHVEVDTRPFLRALEEDRPACVLAAMGAAGLEALFLGFQVVRFRTELGIEVDALDRYRGDGIWVVDARSLRAVVVDLVRNPRRPHPGRRAALRTYFAPPDPERVIEALCQPAVTAVR